MELQNICASEERAGRRQSTTLGGHVDETIPARDLRIRSSSLPPATHCPPGWFSTDDVRECGTTVNAGYGILPCPLHDGSHCPERGSNLDPVSIPASGTAPAGWCGSTGPLLKADREPLLPHGPRPQRNSPVFRGQRAPLAFPR